MKSSVTYPLLAIFAALGASAECVEGHRETIAPGYTVEYKCGVFRAGDLHNNIASDKDCALLCQAAARSVCSYHAGTKRCIVGTEGGKDTPRAGVSYMVKVEETDPFAEEEDPFAVDCEADRDACLQRETSLKADLTQCQATAAAASSAAASSGQKCAVSGWGQGYYQVLSGVNLAGCKARCLADNKCLSYSDDMWGPGGNCYLYEKVAKDVPTTNYPRWGMYDRNCP